MDLLPPSAGSPRQVRLSEILDDQVPIAWHEAVAVARQLALAAQQQAPPIVLPHLSQVLVDTTGDLVVDGGEAAGDNPAGHIGAILGMLLGGAQAPEELVIFQRDSVAEGGSLSLLEFVSKVTFFARPDDKAELATLAARALVYREGRLRDEALASLTRKARETSEPATPTGKSPHTSRRQRFGPVRVLGALAALLLLVALGTSFVLPRPAVMGSSLEFPLAEVARRVQTEVVSGLAAVQERLGFTSPNAPGGRDRELPAPRRAPAKAPLVNGRPPLDAELAYGVVGEAEGLVPAQDEFGVIAAPESEPEPVDLAVYSGSDPGVQPPTLGRPQMPTERIEGISQEAAGELELLVGLDGRVEQARLVPASNRFQDRMMVSAAKTWRFAPATKDGEPVRYRLRIPITW